MLHHSKGAHHNVQVAQQFTKRLYSMLVSPFICHPSAFSCTPICSFSYSLCHFYTNRHYLSSATVSAWLVGQSGDVSGLKSFSTKTFLRWSNPYLLEISQHTLGLFHCRRFDLSLRKSTCVINTVNDGSVDWDWDWEKKGAATSAPQSAPSVYQYTAQSYFRAMVGVMESSLHKPQSDKRWNSFYRCTWWMTAEWW